MAFKKGHKLSPEAEEKRIESMRANPSMGFLGKKHSEETKKKMSEAMKAARERKKWGMPGDDNPAKRPEVKAKIGDANRGRVRSEETRRKTSETIREKLASGEIKYATGMTPWNKGKKFPQVAGENNVNWKGGVTPEHEKFRKSDAYLTWRDTVMKRDDYTCQECGKRGGYMHADHIKPFATYPELRLELSNGRTLCVACHRKTPTYGKVRREPD